MAFQKVLRSRTRYTDEFKIEAVRQVRDRDYSVINVADRLGITTHSLAAWSKKFGPGKVKAEKLDDGEQEARPLNAEFNRVIEERDIRKKAARHFDKESSWGTDSSGTISGSFGSGPFAGSWMSIRVVSMPG